MLVCGNTGIARFKLSDAGQDILMRGVNNWNHGKTAVSQLTKELVGIKELEWLAEAVSFPGNRKYINAPDTQCLNVFMDRGPAQSQRFTDLLARGEFAMR